MHPDALQGDLQGHQLRKNAPSASQPSTVMSSLLIFLRQPGRTLPGWYIFVMKIA